MMPRYMATLLAASAAVAGLGAMCNAQTTADNELSLPPNAKAGSCYARVFVEPVYKTETGRVPLKNAYDKLAVTAPQYGFEEKQVVVKEASRKLEIVPAVYDTKDEQVLVKEASKKLVEVPAVWDTKTEQVLEHPAYTVWKRGKGPVQRMDNSTGEIMCLVEIPAKYKTVTTRVLVKPATTTEEEIPAEYKTVQKRVMVTPPTTRTVEIPAEYETVKVRKLVKPGEVSKLHVPEEYQEIEKKTKVSDGHLEWKPVLCETNMSEQVISDLQTKLKEAGHYTGSIDGIVGNSTLAAVTSYQTAKGLPRGGLTMETLSQLGVRLN